MKNRNKNRRAKRNLFKKNQEKQAYLMLLPQIIGFGLFSLYPILWIFAYSWFDYDGAEAVFNGLHNYIRIFTQDMSFWQSVANTFILSFGKLVIELPLALILAVLLNSKLKGRGFFRSLFFLPNIVSVAIVGLIFYFLFDPFQGIINNFIYLFNADAPMINWFGNKWLALVVIAAASIWQNFGINMLFFLSGLQNISSEIYECAELDGAGKVQQFFHITIPMLKPTLKIIVMLAVIGSLKISDLVLVVTNGAPAGQTEVMMTYVFKYFFQYGGSTTTPQIGYACALGMVCAVILAIVSGIYMRITREKE